MLNVIRASGQTKTHTATQTHVDCGQQQFNKCRNDPVGQLFDKNEITLNLERTSVI